MELRKGKTMSKMGDLIIDIEEMLMRGSEARSIADYLCIPLSWVLEVEKTIFFDDSSYQPTQEGIS
jgi:hypothetical protein